MNFAQVLQLVSALPHVITAVESVKSSSAGDVKKEDVRAAVYSSIVTTEAFGKLGVKNRKAFNKGLDKVIDGIVAMLNAAEWKKEAK
jgi:hypothetical protein